MKKLWTLCGLLIFLIFPLYSNEAEGFIQKPHMLKNTLLFTDTRASALYTLDDGEIITLATGRGIGYHISIAPRSSLIGTKVILENGLHVPVLIDPDTKEIHALQSPVPKAGQVSFTQNDIAAWTSGARLYTSDGRSCDLPAYANLAPISPDGCWVVSNDDMDRLWLTDINNGKHTQISPVLDGGFFYPQWSPNGDQILFSSLNGTLWVYSLYKGIAKELTHGFSPVWKDSSTIFFHRIEVENGVAVNADIYAFNLKEETVEKLTHTQSQFEMDPFWDREQQRLLYHTWQDGKIASLSKDKGETVLFECQESLPVTYGPISSMSKGAVYFEIPYVHQVYDPPDWFGAGSSACGGTAAVMCLAYYGTIEPWPTIASKPYSHESLYGNYICEKYYTILGYYMDRMGCSRGYCGWGAFGYITQNNWADTKGYMAEFAWKNGMANKPVDWSPTRQELIQQVNLRMPFVLLNSLTSSGHYISVIGYENPEATTIIVNDPYGNKNTPGYPSFDGELTRYDWPGYNNGFQNLNIVHCFIYFQADVPQRSDWALDMENSAPDTITTGQHIFLAYTITNEGDTTTAPGTLQWRLTSIGINKLNIDTVLYQIPLDPLEPGEMQSFEEEVDLPDSLVSDTYLLTVEIPPNYSYQEIRYSNNWYEKEMKIIGYPHIHATSPENGATVSTSNLVLFAKFRETINKVNTDSVFLDLNGVNINKDCNWNTREIRRVAETPLEPGFYSAEVRVRNVAGFQSVYRWNFTLVPSALDPHQHQPETFELSIFPNPFNPEGNIHFSLPQSGNVALHLFDIQGRFVKTLYEGYATEGTYILSWDGTDKNGHSVSSGIYLVRLTSPVGTKIQRLVMLK